MGRYPKVYEIILNYNGWRDTIECGIKEIGELFNMDCNAVSYATKRFERKLNSNERVFIKYAEKNNTISKRKREVSSAET